VAVWVDGGLKTALAEFATHVSPRESIHPSADKYHPFRSGSAHVSAARQRVIDHRRERDRGSMDRNGKGRVGLRVTAINCLQQARD